MATIEIFQTKGGDSGAKVLIPPLKILLEKTQTGFAQ
jgi:hypothetical protein